MPFRYFVFFKPFQVLTQFTPVEGKRTLKDFLNLPTDVYPVGRLDYDSEGLLLLTNDKKLNSRLLDPKNQHEREYWAQVEGTITSAAIRTMEQGVVINVNGSPFKTRTAIVKLLEPAPVVPLRNPAIRVRKNIPTSWISITVVEGKNRQVRKMTAAAGFPTLRLIRVRIGSLRIDDMIPGQLEEVEPARFYESVFNDRRFYER
jgi:23S rRNA pseudouridine2457 synthase